MAKMLKVYYDRRIEVVDIDPTLEVLRAAVGGDIETCYPFDDNALIICDEEGKLKGRKLVRAIYDADGNVLDAIAGTFLISAVNVEDGELVDLTDEQIQKYKEMFRYFENIGIYPDGVKVGGRVDSEALKDCVLYKQYEAIAATGQKVRFLLEDENTCFVLLKGKRRFGHRMTLRNFLFNYDPVFKNEEDQWHKRLARAEKILEKSNLWPELKDVFHDLQTMSYDDHKKLGALWINRGSSEEFKSRYPFAFGVTENGDEYIKNDYVNELSCCRLKSMYFGSENDRIKSALKKAIENDLNHVEYRVPVKYDVSVEKRGNKAWYSEEYRGCGNGHYYLALNESTAVFYEDD